jgi:2-oxoglutarate ferredoxin oxidoreductase subunit delta
MKLFPNEVKVIRGEVVIMKDRCKGCGFCVTYCPMDVLEVSRDFNVKGYHFPVVKNPGNCINCGLCEMLCPDFAIWSVLKEEEPVAEI